MKLRTKTFFIVVLALGALIALIQTAVSLTFIRSFDELERRDIDAVLARLRQAVSVATERIESGARDWGVWAETYEFIENRNPGYVESNFDSTSSLGSFSVDFISIHGRSGPPLITMVEDDDLLSKSLLENPSVVNSLLIDDAIKARNPGTNTISKRTFLRHPDGPVYFVASCGVTNNEATAAPNGTVNFGLRIDENFATGIGALVGLDVRMEEIPQESGNSPKEPGSELSFVMLSDKMAEGRMTVLDGTGRGIAQFVVDIPRAIGVKAGEIERLFLYALGGMGLFAVAIGFVLLDVGMLHRLLGLSYEAEEIARSGHFEKRVSERGRDEIGDLSRAVNHLLEEVSAAGEELARANTEMGRILARVEDGLFVISRDGSIAPNHSASLAGILRREEVAGLNFRALLAEHLAPAAAEVAEGFLRILFDPKVREKLTRDLNPLRGVEFNFLGNAGLYETRYLDFGFDRIVDETGISGLLVTLRDRTEAVMLEREIRQSEERAGRQVQLLMSLLHAPPDLVRQFISESSEQIRAIEAILSEFPINPENREQTEADYTARLRNIKRVIHGVKGNAALLKLAFFEEAAQRIEEKVTAVSGRVALSGQDFLGVTLDVSQLVDQLAEANELVQRLLEATSAHGKEGDSDRISGVQTSNDRLVPVLERYLREVCERNHKEARLVTDDFNEDQVPVKHRSLVRDACVQCLRNAVAHGIEIPLKRRDAGKPPIGSVSLATQILGSEFIFSVADDGEGINLSALRARAVKLGIAQADEIEDWPDSRVISLVFLPEVSSAPNAGRDAGLGYGLDFVYARVSDAGGRIGVQFKQGRGTTFTFSLPLPTVSTPARITLPNSES